MNDDFFRDMSKEDQEIIMQAAQTATEYARQASDDRISDRINTIEESGTEILTLDDETRQAILDASASVRETISKAVDPEIFDAYVSEGDL